MRIVLMLYGYMIIDTIEVCYLCVLDAGLVGVSLTDWKLSCEVCALYQIQCNCYL